MKLILGRRLNDLGGWFVAEGTFEGWPFFSRGRTEIEDLVGHPRLATAFTIRWDYRAHDSGMPVDAEDMMDTFRDFENTVVEALESDGLGILVAGFMHNGIRVWTFYVGDEEEVTRRLNAVLPHDPPLPIELGSTPDPTWRAYAELLEENGLVPP